MGYLTCRIKSYIQPFERRLALAELATLTGVEPEPIPVVDGEPAEYRVAAKVPAEVLVEKLAYWESIDGRYTRQVLREATANAARNSIPVEQVPYVVRAGLTSLIPNRRCLRYGTHGIHEYRGKFFPQLVKALANIAGVPEGGLIADPMCGSGTTLVEATLMGCHGIGLDMNPLSVFMAHTKCALLSVRSEDLLKAYQEVRRQLLSGGTTAAGPESYFRSLPAADQNYLQSWFPEQTLWDLDRIMGAIELIPDGAAKALMRLSLSNILRRVSWQKESDLRVRREVKIDADIDPIQEFLWEVGKTVRTVLAFLYQNQGRPLGTFDVRVGDARAITDEWTGYIGRTDAVITSPPYATALPYLDTDRLSLCYLGLLPRPEHRCRARLMIGNREITERERRRYWQIFQESKNSLPDTVTRLIERIDELNSLTEVGFRRRNLPALLAKYFLDMRTVLTGIAKLLKPGAPAFLVVGDNHTIAGGQRIAIETARLLADIAESIGLMCEERIPMDMLVSRDIFKKNAVEAETILVLRRPL